MEKQLTELETKICFQEQQLDELNQLLIEQQKQIDWITKQLKQYAASNKENHGLIERSLETPPPHY